MTKSDTLSRTAKTVLVAASTHVDHHACPPEQLPAAAKRAVIQSMLKAGLLDEAPATDDQPAWRTADDGVRLLLCATQAGLAAVGAPAVDLVEIAPTQPTQVLAQHVELEPEQHPPAPTSATPDQVLTHPVRLRSAAQLVLTAWDDSADGRPALPSAVAALRLALASPAGGPARERGAPRQPRSDTKRAAVLALLRRPEGATVAQVAETTGWASHTVRGFFAGLTKSGSPVEVLERVRQVGSGKQGAKGSYTVYRVKEAG